ncbi:MAG TPA: tRNA (adenosine(37)-N6)-dimethylallyltransferase MiaA [Candidatus Moranbacteria bacterium]|nr:tRNA (adenosine(37)-N6)-dimethylallyltransferase MiaA [Candidatus Moranbacteria bacterium]
MKNIEKKIIVILGPTASGKSSVAIKLAKKFDGEIISADSRQIYKGMEINSGAVPVDTSIDTSNVYQGKQITTFTDKETVSSFDQVKNWQQGFISDEILHYFVGTANPNEEYSVAKFKRQAEKIIVDILKRKKIPIICGGTGFWIKAIVDDIIFPEVKPDWNLRKKLAEKSVEELHSELKKIDPLRARNIDFKNKVRLIRALEVCQKLGKVPQLKKIAKKNNSKNWNFLEIGIKKEKKDLHQRIKLNVTKRMSQGMITEIEKLHQQLPWDKIEKFGLSFKLIPQYLRGEFSSQKELQEKIYLAEKNYAKRQLTWFKKDKKINWLSKYEEIENVAKKFLKN